MIDLLDTVRSEPFCDPFWMRDRPTGRGFEFFLVHGQVSLILPHFLFNSDTALAPGILLLPSSCRFWNCAAATAWVGLALAAFRTFLRCLRFAKPSQDTLSGLSGGCSFTFHTFHTLNSEVALLEGLPRKKSHGVKFAVQTFSSASYLAHCVHLALA